MKIVVVLCCMSVALATGLELSPEEEWNNFKVLYKKTYRSKEEEGMRMRIFLQNKKRVEEHNKDHDRGLVSFKTGINKFSDLTVAEFNQRKKPFPPSRRPRVLQTWNSSSVPNGLVHSLDWRTEGAVTEVKEQGSCESCWIFSAVGAVEAQHFLKTNELVTLSTQNVLDCTVETEKDKESCCPIGWMDDVYEYIQKNNGIDTDESYPYEAKPNTCRFSESSIGATIDGYEDLPVGDETALRRALTSGPISVAIDTKDGDFIHYHSGVYFSDTCKNGEEDLDHAVLVIGYGKEKDLPYWLVKNSWGTSWGEEGYAKIARNKDNHCGIATKASYPYIN